jgi:hypothetical protein
MTHGKAARKQDEAAWMRDIHRHVRTPCKRDIPVFLTKLAAS